MKESLLPLLTCPATGTPFRVEVFQKATETGPDGQTVTDIEEGVLISGGGRVYPITGGVPRIIEGALWLYEAFRARWAAELRAVLAANPEALRPPSESFSKWMLPTLRRFEREWGSHDLEDRTWGFDQATRIEHLLQYVGLPRTELAGKWLLDAGAGTGQLTCSYAALGCEVVGLDLSPAVAGIWRQRARWAGANQSRVHVVQGDVMHPPFRAGSFDVIHSSGVLHHTPSTIKAFDALATLARAGGVVGVWLYKAIPDVRLPLIPAVKARPLTVSVEWLRRFTPRWPPSLLYAVLYVYSSVFQAAFGLNRLLRGRPHDQTIKERVTTLFDTLAPPFVWRHTPDEVMAWFRERGFIEVRNTSLADDPYGFNIRGVRAETVR